jgi:hypothetical protein
MQQNTNMIADVFLRPAQTYSVTTTPGHKLFFRVGRAEILTDADLDYVLGLPNASIRPTPRWHEHVVARINARSEFKPAQAEIDYEGVLCSAQDFAVQKEQPLADVPDIEQLFAGTPPEEDAPDWNFPTTMPEEPKRGPGRPRKAE